MHILNPVEQTDNEPDRTTDPALHGVLEELKRQEPIFHHPELGNTREDFNRLTDEDFWETGASGQRYSREYVWSTLEQRCESQSSDENEDDWHISDFHLREVAPATYLLTYTLAQDARLTRRMTIWQRRTDGWTILYHQGTLVADQPRRLSNDLGA